MTVLRCQLLHIIGREYPLKYDGVWLWYCPVTERTVCRWILKDGRRTNVEDNNAFDILCDCCEVPSQD